MSRLSSLLAVFVAAAATCASAQTLSSNVPYTDSDHERHVLDIYTPISPGVPLRPVVFWIHGGGWVRGDKTEAAIKPRALTERGYVFVSTNYRLLPHVIMDQLISDVASAVGWVHQHIHKYGGNPQHIVIAGHSAGAQLASLICTNHRYLQEQDVRPQVIKGCVPVDGGTYDVAKNIQLTEYRRKLFGRNLPTNAIRQKFGDDPDKHAELSAVSHIAEGKHIPPFLILYFRGNLMTSSQSRLLEATLRQSQIPVTIHGKRDTNHQRLNDELGQPDDSATEALYRFLDSTSQQD